MAKALEEAPSRWRRMSTKLRWRRPSIAFGAKLKTNGGVGLFYFSGHGAQIGGENYVIPVSVNDAAEVETELGDRRPRSVNVMAGAHNGSSMPAVPTPSTPTAHMGFRASTPMPACSSPTRPLRARWLSTEPGIIARTRSISRNGFATPDLSIEDTFKRTLKGVYQDTHGEQTPWISSTFFGDFVFHPEVAEAEEEND